MKSFLSEMSQRQTIPLGVFLVILGYSFQVINANMRDLRSCRAACEGGRGFETDGKQMHRRGGKEVN